MENNESKPVAWVLTKKTIFWGLAIFGPLALPLVWLTPRLTLVQKTICTLITVVLTVVLWRVTIGVMADLTQKMGQLGLS